MKLVIFTICKDEAETIGELLDRMPTMIKGVSAIETLVVSDGSTDSTVKIAKDHKVTKIIEGTRQKRLAPH
jgi:glycosyltransferase involved in cell wall biosynthesis